MIKRRFVIGAAGLAALGGGGVAYAVAGSGKSDRQAFLNDVAGRLHVSPDSLKSAINGAFSDRLDQAVKADRISQAQADAIKARVQQNGGVPFFGGQRHMFFRPGGPFVAGFDAAAGYLGLSAAQLHQQLESGKSLADVAKDRNKDLDGLKSAIKAGVKARLDTAVKNKRITQAQENRLLGGLDNRIDTLVQQKGGRPGGFREHGLKRDGVPPRGFGGGFGPPPGGPPPGAPGFEAPGF